MKTRLLSKRDAPLCQAVGGRRCGVAKSRQHWDARRFFHSLSTRFWPVAVAWCLCGLVLSACDDGGGSDGADQAVVGGADVVVVAPVDVVVGGTDWIGDLVTAVDLGLPPQDTALDIGVAADVPEALTDGLADQASAPDAQDVVAPEDSGSAEDAAMGVPDVVGSQDTSEPDTAALLDVGETDSANQDGGQTIADDVAVVIDVGNPPVEQPTYTTGIGPFSVGKYEETTKCVVVRLKNADPIFVNRITQTLAPGSHHLVVYRSTETKEKPEPFDCTPFLGVLSGTVPIFISQIGDEELNYPEGVALKFDADQMIRIEAHYLNTTGEQIEAKSEIHFETVDADAVAHQAGFLFYGTGDISIPPFSEFVSKPVFKVPPKGSKVFGLTSHQHHYGTYFEIEKATSSSGPGTVIYENDNWEEPPVILFDPPLTFADGEGLRWTCTWQNTSSKTVSFGESANSEMCFLWAYYYPDQGFQCYIKAGFPLPIKGCVVQ